MRVLVLEDDIQLSEYIELGLAALGHQVCLVNSGDTALNALMSDDFDVAALDRLVPGRDGLSVAQEARMSGCRTPLLMLTALGGISERVEGLEAGADDYLVKPFAFSELAARLMALARRPHSWQPPAASLKIGDVELNVDARTVRRAGKAIVLQPREFALLEQLMRSPGKVVTRTLLLERIWNFGFDPQTNIVETHMSRLRTKLNHGFDRSAIRTVRGAGYIMNSADD